MDQTRKLVAPSSTSNNYILILYNYDSNAIIAMLFKNRKSESILQAYTLRHVQLCTTGLHPKLQCLDKEASCALQEHMISEGIDYQFVSLHLHCQNATKHTICTFKNNFIVSLCSTDKNFPIHLWD